MMMVFHFVRDSQAYRWKHAHTWAGWVTTVNDRETRRAAPLEDLKLASLVLIIKSQETDILLRLIDFDAFELNKILMKTYTWNSFGKKVQSYNLHKNKNSKKSHPERYSTKLTKKIPLSSFFGLFFAFWTICKTNH